VFSSCSIRSLAGCSLGKEDHLLLDPHQGTGLTRPDFERSLPFESIPQLQLFLGFLAQHPGALFPCKPTWKGLKRQHRCYQPADPCTQRNISSQTTAQPSPHSIPPPHGIPQQALHKQEPPHFKASTQPPYKQHWGRRDMARSSEPSIRNPAPTRMQETLHQSCQPPERS